MEQELHQAIMRMEAASRKQLGYARAQCIFSIVAAVCCVTLLILVLVFLPKINGLASQAQTVLTNLEGVTEKLAQADLTKVAEQLQTLVSNVDALVTESRDGIAQAVEKLNKIDIEQLNHAIGDLADVIEPIAKFFKSFQG